jgi:hypothetical protein
MTHYAIAIASISLFISIVAYIESRKNESKDAEFWRHFHSAISNAIKPHIESFSLRLDKIERYVEKKSNLE